MKPLFQSEEIERYYATWAYLGVINGKDAYCKQGRHGYPLLSLQPSLEMCEYISPAHYTMVAGEAGKSLRWYRKIRLTPMN